MSKPTLNSNKKSKRGRPPVNTEQIGIHMELDLFGALDGYRSALPDTPTANGSNSLYTARVDDRKGYL